MSDRPVLLVDDNDNDVELTLHAFRRVNMANEVIVAHDGVEAIERLLPADGGPGLDPALVLLDLKMPRLGGLDVLRALRADERTRTVPVVVLTSSSVQRDLIDSYDLGASSYVTKPVDFGEFLESAATLGVYWLAMNRLPEGAS